jgi:hypothetical protein
MLKVRGNDFTAPSLPEMRLLQGQGNGGYFKKEQK